MTALLDTDPLAHLAAARVRCLLEVLTGARPVRQLAPVTSPRLYAALEVALAEAPRPLRPLPRDVRSVHVQRVGDRAAEVCAVVRRGRRVRALALRLEHRDGTWQCTAFAEV